MTMFEYAKNAYRSMKDKPREERWQYFLDYYKWPTLAVLLVIVLLIQGIVMIATRKDTVFGGLLVDGSESDGAEAYMDALEAYLEIDEKEEQIRFQTGISLDAGTENNKVESFQQILASLTVKTTDFVTAPADAFSLCAYSTTNMFADLRDYLDADTLARLEDKLYYIDRSIIEQVRQDSAEGIVSTDIPYPDPHAPETMEDPVPVGISIAGCEEFCASYYSPGMDLYFGMAVNTTRPETVLQFIEYLGF